MDYNISVPDLPKSKINWKYGLKNFDHHSIKVDVNTMRPVSSPWGRSWEEWAQEVFGFS